MGDRGDPDETSWPFAPRGSDAEPECRFDERPGRAEREAGAQETAEQEAEQLASDLSGMSERLEELERAAADAHDRYIRTLADFDNYRKRQMAEMADIRRYANETLIADLLPILDNFERALESGENAQNPQAILEGVRLIYRQLRDTLSKAGLERIEAEGQPFDPTLHEAIMQVEPGPDQPPHHVVEEIRRGYRLNGRVLRAPLVKVTSG
jgi:molecular chaperone GrpE